MATSPLTDSGLKKKIADIEAAHLGGAFAGSIADGGGLRLKRLPNGVWAWQTRYKFNGKENSLSHGTYPLTTLGNAREKHREAKLLLKDGVDPAVHREQAKVAALEASRVEVKNPFKDIALAWFNNWRVGKGIEEKHAKATWGRLEIDILPVVGDLPIEMVNRKVLNPMFQNIEKRAPSLAEKAWVACGQILRYACAHEIIDNNPLAQIKRSDILHDRPVVENQKCVQPNEIPQLMRDIDQYDGVLARLGLQLMALVFIRHAELRGAEWSEFDLDGKIWTIPANRMKKVKGGATPHIIPLSKQVLVIIEQLHQINGGRKHLFPSTKGEGKVMSDGTMNKALERMGYKDRHTVHGFRGMASTALHELGFQHEHIELQLAHIERNKVSAAYNHATYLPQRATMMQSWADFLDEQRKMGLVVKMHRA